MNRRNLLKLSGVASAAAMAGPLGAPLISNQVLAAEAPYPGPYWLFVTAAGGWDPRFHFDPTLNPEQNRLYTEIGKVGNISFAPIEVTPEEINLDVSAGNPLVGPEQFLNKHGRRLTVFNGVDTQTNNHDGGRRAVTCGTIQEGLPALGAVLAAQYGSDKPLPFVSFGGYDATLGLAPLSRVGSGNILRDLAAPNVIAPEREQSDNYHTQDTYSRIRAAQAARLNSQMASQRLQKLQSAQQELLLARSTDRELSAFQAPELIDLPGALGSAERLLRSGQMALAGFRSGLTVSANLSIGGFDTHGNHDQNQRRNLVQLFTGLSLLIDEIEAQSMTDKVYIIVGSDFGRTPHYNGEGGGSGKDHWSVTSYLAMGPGIEGDRVIGATDADQVAVNIDSSSLATVASGGSAITPGAIHRALRKLAGVTPDLVSRFPVAGADLPLFGL